eukprot:scaffold26484_cov132-Isochrysis_galbana.AAC.2
MIGPDAGTVTCQIQTVPPQPGHADPGHQPVHSPAPDQKTPGADSRSRFPEPPVPSTATRCPLLDQWAYFWRVAVVTLAEGLPPGRHVARVGLEMTKPDPAVMKRPPAGAEWERCVAEGKDHKLWLMYWLVGG